MNQSNAESKDENLMSAVTPLPERNLADLPTPHLVTDLPGPKALAAIERDGRVASPSMGRVYPLVPARAKGCVIEDVDGNRFLDANAGIAVNSTGHCHPEVVAAIQRQSESLLHYCSSDWYLPIYAELCERLVATAPSGMGAAQVFLGNSGTEAVEGAIKLARYATKRQNVIAFFGAFHGRSLGALSLTASKSKYRGGFGPLTPGAYHAPYGDADYIERVLFEHLCAPDDVAAIIAEPIQGEGGYVVPPSDFWSTLRRISDEHGIVLIADEVQSGMGRTGRMWAIEHEEVTPDVILAGKGIASGLPLSAVVAREGLMSWGPGKHGSTFGGNPVACAAALATIDLIERELMANASAVGERLMAGTRRLAQSHACIVGVQGRGMMIGIELSNHDLAAEVEQACFRAGLLVLTCGRSSIRLAPPLIMSASEADCTLSILDDVIRRVTATSLTA
jgi:4-aminobutyrate aminotransferase